MEARLVFLGHALMENRCGLLIDACLTQANGHAVPHAAQANEALMKSNIDFFTQSSRFRL
jgi:hypothetical protein